MLNANKGKSKQSLVSALFLNFFNLYNMDG